MSAGHQVPDDARAAASLLLLRDGAAGLEVLMLRRAERDGDMRSGLAVFPGGVLDARDREAHALCLGWDEAAARQRLGVADGALDYFVAAVRETFEEVGLLLADGTFTLAELLSWRRELQHGRAGIAELCLAHGLRLDLRGMLYSGHWLTPPGLPKRFDTRFFVARAPDGQQAEADRGEALELMWLTPATALAPDRGLKLLPVTRCTLQDLLPHARVDDALAAVAARATIPLNMPRMARSAKGQRIVLPHELPYAEVARLDPHGRHDAWCDLLPGRRVRLSARVRRLTAPNAGPMTGPGTNTYLVGAGPALTVIDPGPVGEAHLQATLQALAAEGAHVERILVTHTHRDHSPAAAALAAATGAPVWGRVASHPMWQEEGFAPARQPQHGERFAAGDGCTLRVIHTPGHASNHLCFLLEEERTLFTGDHVMQGSTVVINPPDGDMAAYLSALEALLDEDLEWLAPGHGFLVARPHEVLRALIGHRRAREAKVRAALAAAEAPASLEELLPQVYADTPVALHALAARSLLAHLIKLRDEGAALESQQRWSAAGS